MEEDNKKDLITQLIPKEEKGLNIEVVDSEPKKQLWQKEYYVPLAMLGGVLFGLSSFIVGLISTEGATIQSLMPFAFGFTLFWILYHSVVGYQNKQRTGYWNLKSSYTREDPYGNQEFYWFAINGVLIRAILGCGTFFSMYFTIKNAYLANASMGVCISLTSSAMFMTAAAFYFLFGQKVTMKQIIGMLLILVAVFFIASKQQDTQGLIENPISIIWPIYFAFQFAVFQTSVAINGRLVIKKTKMSGIQFAADSFMIMAVCYFIYGFYYHFSVLPYTLRDTLITALGGFFLVSAIWCFTEATSHGKGGPALALTQLQSVVMIVLEMVILGARPQVNEYVGFAFGLAGALAIAFK